MCPQRLWARDSPRFPVNARAPFGAALGAADTQGDSREIELGLSRRGALLHLVEVELDAVRHHSPAFAQKQPDSAYALRAVLLRLRERLVEHRLGDGKLVHAAGSGPVVT